MLIRSLVVYPLVFENFPTDCSFGRSPPILTKRRFYCTTNHQHHHHPLPTRQYSTMTVYRLPLALFTNPWECRCDTHWLIEWRGKFKCFPIYFVVDVTLCTLTSYVLIHSQELQEEKEEGEKKGRHICRKYWRSVNNIPPLLHSWIPSPHSAGGRSRVNWWNNILNCVAPEGFTII